MHAHSLKLTEFMHTQNSTQLLSIKLIRKRVIIIIDQEVDDQESIATSVYLSQLLGNDHHKYGCTTACLQMSVSAPCEKKKTLYLL